VQDSRSTLPALFGAVTAAPVGTAWLNALPSGVDIVAAPVSDRGAQSSGVPGRKNGDVLVARTASGDQFYLVLDDGIAPITPLQQAVLDARFPADPIPITVNATIQLPTSKRLPEASATTKAPDTPPQLAAVNTGETVCATTTDAAQPPALAVGGSAEGLSGAVPTSAVTDAGGALADAVLVPAGKFELVRVPGSGGYAVITDLGIRYAVPSADVLGMLGYAPTAAIDIPTALVSSIPAGVNLDPAAALRPATAAAN
jgi:hypothetical protein